MKTNPHLFQLTLTGLTRILGILTCLFCYNHLFSQVTVFPYNEGFETGLGAWTNATGDDMDWTRNSGGTPSNNTGPSGANGGNWYMYTEASNPNNPSMAAYLEATFDFTGQTYPVLTFYYHMFGADMGDLSIDVNNGFWTSGIWSVTGQQHTSNGATWTQAVVDLSAYAGQTVTIRFNGVTGSGWMSDIAIDDISICTINPGVSTISQTTSCGATTVDLSVSGQDAGGTIQWQQSTDNVTFTDIVGATTANYTTGVLASGNTYYFRAVVSNGCSNYSNTVSVFVTAGNGTVAAFPYSEGFETGWGVWNNVGGDDMDWSRNTGQTPSNNTGPSGANELSWYAYTEASNPNNPSKNAYLEASFDFTGQVNPMLSFYYHMCGTNMGTLYIDVNGTNVWSISGSQQTAIGDPWRQATIDLSAYANVCNATIRFRGLTGSGWSSDIAIDNISICTIKPGTASISTNSLCTGNTVNLSLSGYDASGTIQWQESTDNITFTDIVGATTANYTTGVLTPGTTYYYRALVSNGCTNYSNTQSVYVSAGAGSISAYPYLEGFETGWGNWTNPATDNFDWSRNTGQTPSNSTGPSAANEGNWYAYTESSNPNNPGKTAYLEASFDFSSVTSPYLTFFYHMFGGQMGTLYVDINGTNVYSLNGQQQGAMNDPWALASLDLSAYGGQCNTVVRLRGVTGGGWSSDMSVDRISVIDVGGGLPIELLYFNAELVDDRVDLNWSTASELNNDYFTIERSKDGIEFHEIATIPGAGNSSELIEYSDVDYSPLEGVSFYRLKQTDYNGDFEYSNTVMVRYTNSTFSVYPNPFVEGQLSVKIPGDKSANTTIELYNAIGELVYSTTVTKPSGTTTFSINLPSSLPTGVYIVNSRSEFNEFRERLIIE